MIAHEITTTVVVLIIAMMVLPLHVSAATLSAGISDERWRNTTSTSIACSFERATASAEQPATFKSHHRIRIQKSVDVPHGTVTQHASIPATSSIDSPTISPTIATSTSTSPPKCQPFMNFGDFGSYMNNITNGIEALIRAQSPNLLTTNNNNNLPSNQTTNTTVPTNNPSPTTHGQVQPAASLAMVDHVKYKLVFLNTTAPSYVLLDHHNAKVIVWTIPTKVSSATHKTWILRLGDHLAAWLPLLELLGVVGLFWKVGWWVREKRRVRGQGGRAAEGGA